MSSSAFRCTAIRALPCFATHPAVSSLRYIRSATERAPESPMSARFVSFLLLFSLPVLAADDGDKWEVTSKMTVEGMDMPMGAQTHTVCSPKDWEEPPGGTSGPGGECTVSDVQKSGNKFTWKATCAGPPAM